METRAKILILTPPAHWPKSDHAHLQAVSDRMRAPVTGGIGDSGTQI